MNANGQRFWMLAEKAHWSLAGENGLGYNSERQTLCLRSRSMVSSFNTDTAEESLALASVDRIPQALDTYSTRAYWDETSNSIVATGALSSLVPLYTPPDGQSPTDLAMGYDGVLYIALPDGIVLLDRRNRWGPVTVQEENFVPWRLTPDPLGGMWVLDRTNRQLGHVQGLPYPEGPARPFDPGTFRPCEENPHPPTLTTISDSIWPINETPIGLSCNSKGQVVLLSWLSDQEARIRIFDTTTGLTQAQTLQGVRFPYSLTWVSDDRFGVMLVGVDEVPVYSVDHHTQTFVPDGDLYPLPQHEGGPFLHGLTYPPHFPTTTHTRPLHRLSLPRLATTGEAKNTLTLDSGSSQTEWHRLYLEAHIPLQTGLVINVATSNSGTPPADNDPNAWHAHHFGDTLNSSEQRDTPQGVWVPYPSEIPYHAGLLLSSPEPNRSGLFTILLQRANRRVRTLRGRFLWIRVAVHGNGKDTPEIAALRIYAPRFSYVNHYLPELYRETEFGPEAEQVGASTRADFLERFVNNCEGVFTDLEDRIGAAHLFTDPHSTPDEALDWLGTWMGVTFEPGFPPEHRREWLAAAPQFSREHGTLNGLQRALDIVSGGGVRDGGIVVVEDFRLRRTFATILGADLADELDPILGGLTVSGNSFVGETLFLGQEYKKEFLALFGDNLPLTDREDEQIQDFFDRLAHRVTILVHQGVTSSDLGLIRRIVELESPAHVLTRVVVASRPFLVGLASMVSVDTYLGTLSPTRPVEVGRSFLGQTDYFQHPPSLDPRIEHGNREDS